MKILFYTSSKNHFSDRYLIDVFTKHYPLFEYKIVEVQLKKKPQNIRVKAQKKIAEFVYKLRNGKDQLTRDEKKLAHYFDKQLTQQKFISTLNKRGVSAVNDNESVEIIKAFDPDFIIQAGAGILKPHIFELAKNGTLNVHHGLAPEVRGMRSTLWCLYGNLRDRIGVTCHLIDSNLDTGPVISQYHHQTDIQETYLDIQQRLIKEGGNLLIDAIKRLVSPHEFVESTVNSYYFSHFDYRFYNDLLKTNFKGIELDHQSLKEKKVIKRILVAKKKENNRN